MHSSFFIVYKLSNMGIQENENSFFTCDFMVVSDRFFWNLGSDPNDSILHYLSRHECLLLWTFQQGLR